MRRANARDAGVGLALLASLGIAACYYAKALRDFDHRADANSALSYADREVAGGNSIVVDQEAAYEARALIPVSESYRVVTGGRLRNATSLTFPFVEGWFRYFLMPRRPSPTARWIICYGCHTSGLRGSYIARWHDTNRISIGQIR